MFENNANNSPSHNDEYNDNSSSEYLQRAAQACATGDKVLGMHLYLAAFERAQHADGSAPEKAALDGMRQAWQLACSLKERSIAEYIFERLEPYLTGDEVAACAEQLQRLALDKLEEFGLSREDLEDMTDMISQDFLGFEGGPVVQVEHITTPPFVTPPATGHKASAKPETAAPDKASHDVSEKATEGTAENTTEPSHAAPDEVDEPKTESLAEEIGRAIEVTVRSRSDESKPVVTTLDRLSFDELAGYDAAVAALRDMGVGMQNDPQFQQLVSLLNAQHGLENMPTIDSMLFRAPAREDANRLMTATLGELGLPAIRMRMDENMQGIPVLSVMAQADNQPRLNAARNAFEGEGVLLLEDLDTWMSPLSDPMGDDFGSFLLPSLSRGAREAISLINSAAEHPDVVVLASASTTGEVDPFFLELVEPLTVIEIDNPTDKERNDIWTEIAQGHPSLSDIDRGQLVRYSRGMPRFDIYMAAREAVEESYKASLVARSYVPVSPSNLFDKLAAYQPLESDEYRALEEAVVDGFRLELEQLDDLLKGDS